MRRKIICSMAFMSLIGLSTILGSCRPQNNSQADAVVVETPINQLYAMEKYRSALQREHQAFNQLRKHAAKFDLSWPYTSAIQATESRMRKLENVILKEGGEPKFIPLQTMEADSIKEALEMDAELLERLMNFYSELAMEQQGKGEKRGKKGGRNVRRSDQQIFRAFSAHINKHFLAIKNHDGIPPEEMPEYGRKRVIKK